MVCIQRLKAYGTKMYNRLVSTNLFGSGDSACQQHNTNDGGAVSSPAPRHQRCTTLLERLASLAKVHRRSVSNSIVRPIQLHAFCSQLTAEEHGHNWCYNSNVHSEMMTEEYE